MNAVCIKYNHLGTKILKSTKESPVLMLGNLYHFLDCDGDIYRELDYISRGGYSIAFDIRPDTITRFRLSCYKFFDSYNKDSNKLIRIITFNKFAK